MEVEPSQRSHRRKRRRRRQNQDRDHPNPWYVEGGGEEEEETDLLLHGGQGWLPWRQQQQQQQQQPAPGVVLVKSHTPVLDFIARLRANGYYGKDNLSLDDSMDARKYAAERGLIIFPADFMDAWNGIKSEPADLFRNVKFSTFTQYFKLPEKEVAGISHDLFTSCLLVPGSSQENAAIENMSQATLYGLINDHFTQSPNETSVIERVFENMLKERLSYYIVQDQNKVEPAENTEAFKQLCVVGYDILFFDRSSPILKWSELLKQSLHTNLQVLNRSGWFETSAKDAYAAALDAHFMATDIPRDAKLKTPTTPPNDTFDEKHMKLYGNTHYLYKSCLKRLLWLTMIYSILIPAESRKLSENKNEVERANRLSELCQALLQQWNDDVTRSIMGFSNTSRTHYPLYLSRKPWTNLSDWLRYREDRKNTQPTPTALERAMAKLFSILRPKTSTPVPPIPTPTVTTPKSAWTTAFEGLFTTWFGFPNMEIAGFRVMEEEPWQLVSRLSTFFAALFVTTAAGDEVPLLDPKPNPNIDENVDPDNRRNNDVPKIPSQDSSAPFDANNSTKPRRTSADEPLPFQFAGTQVYTPYQDMCASLKYTYPNVPLAAEKVDLKHSLLFFNRHPVFARMTTFDLLVVGAAAIDPAYVAAHIRDGYLYCMPDERLSEVMHYLNAARDRRPNITKTQTTQSVPAFRMARSAQDEPYQSRHYTMVTKTCIQKLTHPNYEEWQSRMFKELTFSCLYPLDDTFLSIFLAEMQEGNKVQPHRLAEYMSDAMILRKWSMADKLRELFVLSFSKAGSLSKLQAPANAVEYVAMVVKISSTLAPLLAAQSSPTPQDEIKVDFPWLDDALRAIAEYGPSSNNFFSTDYTNTLLRTLRGNKKLFDEATTPVDISALLSSDQYLLPSHVPRAAEGVQNPQHEQQPPP